MNRDELRETCDTLETFLLLKRQNLLIFAWMELKKRNRRMASLRGSRASSLYAPSATSRSHARPNPPPQRPPPPPPLELAASKTQNHSTPKIMRKEGRGEGRLATENYAPKEAFETFNRQQGNRFTLTEKMSREVGEPQQAHTQNEEEGDSEEFEDIVLDRLSKLEENINRLMKEKRIKDQQRGYVGAPLASPPFAHPHPPHVHYETSYDSQFPPEDHPAHGFASILERKRRFFEGLKQSQKEGRNIVYNLKYIPQPEGNSPAIQKIRRIFQNQSEEDNFIDGVDYFLAGNPRAQEEPRDRNLTSIYLPRRGLQAEDPRVHFAGSHLEMQTVIEPPRKRYFHRNSFNSSNSGDPHIKVEELQKSQVSRNSEYSARAKNLSAYY